MTRILVVDFSKNHIILHKVKTKLNFLVRYSYKIFSLYCMYCMALVTTTTDICSSFVHLHKRQTEPWRKVRASSAPHGSINNLPTDLSLWIIWNYSMDYSVLPVSSPFQPVQPHFPISTAVMDMWIWRIVLLQGCHYIYRNAWHASQRWVLKNVWSATDTEAWETWDACEDF